MDLLSGLLLITSIHVLAAASPGPDFVLVSQQTLANGKKSGFMCSIGIALGLSIHIIYSAFGFLVFFITSIISSPLSFSKLTVITRLSWIKSLNIEYALALDHLSIVLLLLTLFLALVCILVSWQEITEKTGFYYFNLLATFAGIIGVFSATDLFLFFFSFYCNARERRCQ